MSTNFVTNGECSTPFKMSYGGRDAYALMSSDYDSDCPILNIEEENHKLTISLCGAYYRHDESWYCPVGFYEWLEYIRMAGLALVEPDPRRLPRKHVPWL